MAKPVIAFVVIFNFITGRNEFNISFVVTLSQPELQNLAMGTRMVFSFIPMLVIFLAFQNYFVAGGWPVPSKCDINE